MKLNPLDYGICLVKYGLYLQIKKKYKSTRSHALKTSKPMDRFWQYTCTYAYKLVQYYRNTRKRVS